jgi:flagellar biosynthesis/type III secretory pathway protein FliH
MRRIDVLDPAALDGLRIIKADHMARLIRAHDVLSEAETWARDRKAMLAAELEAECRAAHERAYAEGLARFADAVARYGQETDVLAGRVIDLVRACLSRALTSLPSDAVLHDLIAPVLREFRSDQEITIMVHPDRLPDLKAAIAQASRLVSPGVVLTTRADVAVDLADCLIYTEEEVFSVSIPLTCDILCRALSDVTGPEADDVG